MAVIVVILIWCIISVAIVVIGFRHAQPEERKEDYLLNLEEKSSNGLAPDATLDHKNKINDGSHANQFELHDKST